MKYIGLSLSACVKDIVLGKIRLDDVYLVRAATCFPDREAFYNGIARYGDTYWLEFPHEADQVVKWLWENGKIYQPRLYEEEVVNVANYHWLSAIGEVPVVLD